MAQKGKQFLNGATHAAVSSTDEERDPVVLAAGTMQPSRSVYVGEDGDYLIQKAGMSEAKLYTGLKAGTQIGWSIIRVQTSGGGPITEGHVVAEY